MFISRYVMFGKIVNGACLCMRENARTYLCRKFNEDVRRCRNFICVARQTKTISSSSFQSRGNRYEFVCLSVRYHSLRIRVRLPSFLPSNSILLFVFVQLCFVCGKMYHSRIRFVSTNAKRYIRNKSLPLSPTTHSTQFYCILFQVKRKWKYNKLEKGV